MEGAKFLYLCFEAADLPVIPLAVCNASQPRCVQLLPRAAARSLQVLYPPLSSDSLLQQ